MPKKDKELFEIKVVANPGDSVVVEWVGQNGVQRGVLPNSVVKPDGTIAQDDLMLASPYGLPFEDLIKPRSVKPEQLAKALRNHGIWTLADLYDQSRFLPSILQALYGLDVGSLIQEVEAGLAQQEAK